MPASSLSPYRIMVLSTGSANFPSVEYAGTPPTVTSKPRRDRLAANARARFSEK